MFNKRKDIRLKTHIKAQLVEFDRIVGEAFIDDISKSGMKISPEKPLSVNNILSLKVKFRVPSTSTDVEIDTFPRWVEQSEYSNQIGLRFSKSETSEKTEEIAHYVNSLLASAYGIR